MTETTFYESPQPERPSTQPLFHIVSSAEWRAARELGRYAPPSLGSEGFVHFSYLDQVARTANLRFRGQAGLIVVEFDAALLNEPVIDEDLYGANELFPHVYGAIPTTAAVAEHTLPLLSSGEFAFG